MSEFKDESRANWGLHGDGKPDIQQLSFGCLQRIATATEAMAQNYQKLIGERDYYKHESERQRQRSILWQRSNAALRGVITKLKNGRS